MKKCNVFVFFLIISFLLKDIFAVYAFADEINIHNNLKRNDTVQAENLNNSKAISDSFENGLSDIWYKEMVNEKFSGSVSYKHTKSGKPSYRIELRKADDNVQGGKRAEIRLDNESPLEEHTYTFYTLLPKGGDEDYKIDPEGSEIIAQWHNQPDANEEWTTPPLGLGTYNGEYIIGRCWDDSEITNDDQMSQKGNRVSYNLGSYKNDKGKWIEWKFHIKWGWESAQKPILEVYKNGKKVLNCNGLPNTTNDKVGVYLKLGIYKWDWAQKNDSSILSKRVIYFSDVSVK